MSVNAVRMVLLLMGMCVLIGVFVITAVMVLGDPIDFTGVWPWVRAVLALVLGFIGLRALARLK